MRQSIQGENRPFRDFSEAQLGDLLVTPEPQRSPNSTSDWGLCCQRINRDSCSACKTAMSLGYKVALE